MTQHSEWADTAAVCRVLCRMCHWQEITAVHVTTGLHLCSIVGDMDSVTTHVDETLTLKQTAIVKKIQHTGDCNMFFSLFTVTFSLYRFDSYQLSSSN